MMLDVCRRVKPLFCWLLAAVAAMALLPASSAAGDSPFVQRGYYLTLMRMPTFDLEDWKQIVQCTRDDGGNVLILWMAGGFRSQKFPETWAYNRDHENIREDFVRELIAFAHTQEVKVLLGFTPFGYDGVNRMSQVREDWAATGPDGVKTARFGIHSWGHNLCPARDDVQQFMIEYIREMAFDLYPNADGLLIESSDYAGCHCPQCGPKYFDHEFRFVKAISDEVWLHNPDAQVLVYPHYFAGRKDVPAVQLTGTSQPFDARWTMFYTPHSAAPDANLTAKSRGAIWSDDGPALRTPSKIRDGARRAREVGCSGYVPSLEAFSYVTTEPEEGQAYLVGRRQKPFGFGWLADGGMPFNELPVRISRLAYREYSRNPDLSEQAFRGILGGALFGSDATPQAIDDALFLQQVLIAERSWRQAAPLAEPLRVKALRDSNQLTAAARDEMRQSLSRMRAIEERYQDRSGSLAEMHRIAAWVTDQWSDESAELLSAEP